MTFEQLDLIEPILNALHEEGYHTPTPIQETAIPIVLNHTDLLGCAQTGTGKTAAFAIPILQNLYKKYSKQKQHRFIKVLIVTPTRELAIQIGESFGAYGRNLPFRQTVVFGGVNQNPQVNALKAGVDILIATPGRLLDLHQQGFIHLQHLDVFVLDEADRMLDMGFIHDVRKLINIIPEKRQSLFFSATMPETIRNLASNILRSPQEVHVTPVSSTADTIDQSIYKVDAANKRQLLAHLLEDKSITRALVFTRTKHGADKVQRYLSKGGIVAEAIHGNKSQNARQRALSSFKDSTTRVLVATDIAARGIDIDELNLVVNFELPNIPETYVHRIGRTGRAGLEGKAISFCDQEEAPYLKDIQKLINKQIPIITEHPFPAINLAPEAVANKPQPSRKKQGTTKTAGRRLHRR